ncbi:hypothetical protein D5086_017950 [Populus alba]|uniref:Uncharacterized protein n=1 Tax=Populus alba TaxID=43335 RepID=A0ACC4BND8_POPAL
MEVDSGAVSCLVGSVGGCRVDEMRLVSSAGLVLLGGAGLVLLGNRGRGGGVGWIAAARGSCYGRVLLLSVAMSVEKKGVDYIYMGDGSRERGL